MNQLAHVMKHLRWNLLKFIEVQLTATNAKTQFSTKEIKELINK